MDAPSKPVTLQDVSRATGYSLATVGYALRGDGKLRAATRDRVREVARRMGYVPNPAAAALATQRHLTDRVDGLPVAYVSRPGPDARGGVELDHHFCGQVLAAKGYRLEAVELDADGRRDGARFRELYHRGVVGVILGRLGDLGEVPAVPWNWFATVGLGGRHAFTPIHRVQLDVASEVRLAWRKAWECGYRRIGVIVGSHPGVALPDDDLRLGAALASARRWPAGEVPPYSGSIHDLDAMWRWYAHWRPDVVIAFPAHIRYRMMEEGIRLPEDCGFIGLEINGGIEEAPAGNVTCFLSSVSMLVESAALMLDDEIRHGRRGFPPRPQVLLLPPRWNPGCTLPERRPARSRRR